MWEKWLNLMDENTWYSAWVGTPKGYRSIKSCQKGGCFQKNFTALLGPTTAMCQQFSFWVFKHQAQQGPGVSSRDIPQGGIDPAEIGIPGIGSAMGWEHGNSEILWNLEIGYTLEDERLEQNSMEVDGRWFSFPFMGDGCRFQPLIFQGVKDGWRVYFLGSENIATFFLCKTEDLFDSLSSFFVGYSWAWGFAMISIREFYHSLVLFIASSHGLVTHPTFNLFQGHSCTTLDTTWLVQWSRSRWLVNIFHQRSLDGNELMIFPPLDPSLFISFLLKKTWDLLDFWDANELQTDVAGFSLPKNDGWRTGVQGDFWIFLFLWDLQKSWTLEAIIRGVAYYDYVVPWGNDNPSDGWEVEKNAYAEMLGSNQLGQFYGLKNRKQ